MKMYSVTRMVEGNVVSGIEIANNLYEIKANEKNGKYVGAVVVKKMNKDDLLTHIFKSEIESLYLDSINETDWTNFYNEVEKRLVKNKDSVYALMIIFRTATGTLFERVGTSKTDIDGLEKSLGAEFVTTYAKRKMDVDELVYYTLNEDIEDILEAFPVEKEWERLLNSEN